MTDFTHLSPTQRKTAEIVLKTREWLESQDKTVDATAMEEASSLFRKPGLSRALLYSATYRSIWDDGDEGPSSRSHRKVKRLASENAKLKEDMAKARRGFDQVRTKLEEREESIRALRKQIAGLEVEKQDLLAGFVDQ